MYQTQISTNTELKLGEKEKTDKCTAHIKKLHVHNVTLTHDAIMLEICIDVNILFTSESIYVTWPLLFTRNRMGLSLQKLHLKVRKNLSFTTLEPLVKVLRTFTSESGIFNQSMFLNSRNSTK